MDRPPADDNVLARLPSVDRVVDRVLRRRPDSAREKAATAARVAIAALRADMAQAGRGAAKGARTKRRGDLLGQAVDEACRQLDHSSRPSLRPVINATGVILHTNLGRARMPDEAVTAMVQASGYANLELSLADGSRISRQDHLRDLLCLLTGAGDALVVNNNAAAVWLVLRNVAGGRRAVISRGELVEIGDSFRLPEIMGEAGVELVEIGTTNRTTLGDYRRVLAGDPPRRPEETVPAAVVLVHPSNYRVLGYTAKPSREDIVELAHSAGAVVIEDLGSGVLTDLAADGLGGEPTPEEALRAGVDLVTFSGDKLLGGPQSGVVAGRPELIGRCRCDPLCRCLRPDKITLAALEATLRLYATGRDVRNRVPVLRMLTESPDTVRHRAVRLKRAVLTGVRRLNAEAVRDPNQEPDLPFELRLATTTAEAGGGSLPAAALSSWALRISGAGLSPDELWHRLAAGDPSVVARRREEALWLDLRTVDDSEVPTLAGILARALVEHAAGRLEGRGTCDGT